MDPKGTPHRVAPTETCGSSTTSISCYCEVQRVFVFSVVDLVFPRDLFFQKSKKFRNLDFFSGRISQKKNRGRRNRGTPKKKIVKPDLLIDCTWKPEMDRCKRSSRCKHGGSNPRLLLFIEEPPRYTREN